MGTARLSAHSLRGLSSCDNVSCVVSVSVDDPLYGASFLKASTRKPFAACLGLPAFDGKRIPA